MINKLLIFDLQGTLVKNMRPPTLNGNRDSLIKIQEKGYLLSVFTGATQSETINILSKLNILNTIISKMFVVTSGSQLPSKPNPAAIQYLIKISGSLQTYYLGDTNKDFITSKNATVPFIYFGKRRLGKFQVQNLDDLASNDLLG